MSVSNNGDRQMDLRVIQVIWQGVKYIRNSDCRVILWNLSFVPLFRISLVR